MINQIKEKLAINQKDIKLDFFFHPNPIYKQLIGDWVKNSIDNNQKPSIKITIKLSPKTKEEQVVLKFGCLELIYHAHTQQIENAIQKIEHTMKKEHIMILDEIRREHAMVLDEIRNQINRMEIQCNDLEAEKNLHSLLDFVSKFRVKIVEKLVSDGKVPPTCINWCEMNQHLIRSSTSRQLQRIIEDTAEELGLKYDDWIILKYKSEAFNILKHPMPRLEKTAALAKVQTLYGTRYEDCCGPLQNIIDLFEKNEWE